jgi:DUF4097 and DUF4098 domain-containing protein YvlB
MTMNRVLAKSVFTVGLLAMLLAVPVYGASVNKSVKVPEGGESGGATSVNGSITVGDGATVTGTLHTVNGKIRIGSHAHVIDAKTVNGSVSLDDDVTSANLETVNGSIGLGRNTTASGTVSAVNGRIRLENGARVDEEVSTVNGDILLEGGTVGEDVTTVNGDVRLSDSAAVEGDIVIKKPRSWGSHNNQRDPEIVIGPGSRVGGVIRLERKVKLYISESAEVGGVEGVMTMSDVARFSGDSP